MNHHAENKLFISRFLRELPLAEPDGIASVLERYCHPDVIWEIFYPFNTIRGIAAAASEFWVPLKRAFPDHEQRINLILGGEYEGHEWVSTLGHVAGSFFAPWLGIPPTQGLTYLRFGFNVLMREGRIAKAYVLLDVLDVMRQAGFYPLRQMPGSPEQWPAPPAFTGVTASTVDTIQGAKSIEIVRTMQRGLREMDLKNLQHAKYSPLWHENMDWYGPAGIGSTRGKRGFREYHGHLFLRAFPDRHGVDRDPNGPQDAPGHYIRIGDGRFAVTSGWPSLFATHLGDGWLGIGPSGRKVEMRVADWYRVSDDNLLVENWVAIDVLHILRQAGLDILNDLQYFADRTKRRWPD